MKKGIKIDLGTTVSSDTLMVRAFDDDPLAGINSVTYLTPRVNANGYYELDYTGLSNGRLEFYFTSDANMGPGGGNSFGIEDINVPDVLYHSDYYPGGQQQVGRTYPGNGIAANDYRYGHNSQHHENEVYKGAYSAEHWMYDSRILRRWELDPIVKPWESPYACFNNNAVYFSDILGLEGDGDGNKNRPTPKEGQKKTDLKGTTEFDAAAKNKDAKTDAGFDGKNYWQSVESEGTTYVTSFDKENTSITSNYKFPSSSVPNDQGGEANDVETGKKNSMDNAEPPKVPQTVNPKPIEGTEPKARPIKGGQPPADATQVDNGGPIPCNPYHGSVNIPWIHNRSSIGNDNIKKALDDIKNALSNFQSCNKFVTYEVHTTISTTAAVNNPADNPWRSKTGALHLPNTIFSKTLKFQRNTAKTALFPAFFQ